MEPMLAIVISHIGEGQEGSAGPYVDVTTGELVIMKTYAYDGRNEVPHRLAGEFARSTTKWPGEIEAGLLLGEWTTGNETAYVPVKDYFILQADHSDWSWAMVTPFIEASNLLDLAAATKLHERTPQKLEKIFRPVLNTMLENLQPLHEAGYCHDDIKPENIFVADTMHWLLGDLDSVRHLKHPWHATRRWKRENQWAQCKLNDLRRALKSYMWFIRNACHDPWTFVADFYAEQQAWSKLYWAFVRQPVSVAVTLEISKQFDSAQEQEWKPDGGWMYQASGGDACLVRFVDLELTCTTLRIDWLEWWPFT